MRPSASHVALRCTALVLVIACSKGEAPADTVATATPEPAPAATSPLQAIQGRWNVRSIPMQGDTTPTTYVLDASGDTAAWTLTFTGRSDKVKLHVLSVDGDSIVARTDEFDSARRKGMRVVSTSIMRPEGDRLTGTSTARYRTTGPDSVLQLRTEGTRIP